MKSKANFEIDFRNQNRPVIKLAIHNTEDVRDKIASNFIEQLGHESNLCSIVHDGVVDSTGAGYYTITTQEDPYLTCQLELCKLHPDKEQIIIDSINEIKGWGNQESNQIEALMARIKRLSFTSRMELLMAIEMIDKQDLI